MTTPWTVDDGSIRIRSFEVGQMGNNIHVIACARTGAALVVDAGFDVDRIVAECADVEPVGIVITHGHFDHVGEAPALADRLGVPWRIHPDDVRSDLCTLTPDGPLVHGETITVGELAVDVIHTPGHTPGSTCLKVGDHLFTGDTLFPGGPGATRFEYSSFEQIMASLRERLFVHDDRVTVYPGHGASTTLGTERPHVDEWERRGW